MQEIGNKFVKDLETLSEREALYNLVRTGISEQAQQSVFTQVNFYPDTELLEKVRRQRRAEQGAMKKLNEFAAGLGL